MRSCFVHGHSRHISLRAFGAALAGIALFLAAAGWSLLPDEAVAAPPPRTGWMESFSVAETNPPAPTSEFTGRDGKSYTLERFRGKVVLVNFWATWCGPCVRELPSLKRLNARIGGEEFVVLALSQDRGGWTRMTPFLEKHDLDGLPAFHDPKAMAARAAMVRALPTSVLYGRGGRELGRLTGHAEWDSDEALALIRHYIES